MIDQGDIHVDIAQRRSAIWRRAELEELSEA